jgi:hypothetical protein
LETPISKRAPHPPKKETTRSITYRLPARMVEELETEADEKQISQNVLVKQIVEKYLQWDRFASKIGMIPVPKNLLMTLGDDMKDMDINKIVDAIVPVISESVLFMKGNYDLKRCIEALEDYMKASGMKSDHRMEGNIHHFIIQHELGMKWSLFTEMLLKSVFNEFVPDKDLKCKLTDKTVIASIPLGSDFDEHSY